jgi:vitamin B12 transporter
MNRTRLSQLLPALLLSAAPALAETPASDTDTFRLPETVVSASRFETPLAETGRNVDVRTHEDFQTQETVSLTDSLQTIPGVRTSNLGGPGSPGVTPIEIRGFRTTGTQLLLNGLRLNDPSSIAGTGEAFFSYLTTNEIAGVELLRGATGVNFGSDGQAGAVNLITHRPEAGQKLEASIRGGSFGTLIEDTRFNYGTDKAAVAGAVTRIDSKGLDTHGNYENLSTLLQGKVQITENFNVQPILRLVNARNDLDTSPTVTEGEFVPNQDTDRNNVRARSLFYGVTGEYEDGDDFTSRVSLYTNDNDRHYFYDFGGFEFRNQLAGDSVNADWQNVFNIDSISSQIVAGAEFEHQRIDSESPGLEDSSQQDRFAVFARERLSLLEKALIIDTGIRVTHISSVDRTVPTLEAAGAYRIEATGTKLHSSIAQGFRAPTLFEARGIILDDLTGETVNVGNGDLEEERSLSFDAGITQELDGEGSVFDVTVFNIDADQTILFDFANRTHINSGSGQFQGIETGLSFKPLTNLLIRGAYTHLSKAQAGAFQRLQRRPYNVFALSAAYSTDLFTVYGETVYRDEAKLDFFGIPDRFTEGSYTVVNFAATFDISENLQAFARLDNVLDEDYTEAGYRMPGIGAQGGVRMKIGSF